VARQGEARSLHANQCSRFTSESFIDLLEPHCAPGLAGEKVRYIAKSCVEETVALGTTRKITPIDLVGHPAEEFNT